MATLEAQATSGQKKAQQPEWAGFHPWIRWRGLRFRRRGAT